MKHIFVIGAGTMGLDIAHVFASHEMKVIVRDINDSIIEAASARLSKSLIKRLERGKISAEYMNIVLGNISFTTDLSLAAHADVVIEAIVENSSVKKSVFGELDAICDEKTIFCTNTSSISITDIATSTKRQDKFIGMHFFNPPTAMKLVEVIRGVHTSDETYSYIMELSREIEKEPVSVQENPGFVVNRILIPMINEAIGIVSEGIASPEDIDTAMKLGCNHPMGPLALGDLVGLDVVLAIMDTLYSETGDPKYRAHTLLRKMVRGKLLGRKTGRGFFTYTK
ncbi:MAG: NAD-binding protein [Clostridia bacterium]|nr:NAD-binding protein [Clostridia bacterium]